jgi:hypothetical protein
MATFTDMTNLQNETGHWILPTFAQEHRRNLTQPSKNRCDPYFVRLGFVVVLYIGVIRWPQIPLCNSLHDSANILAKKATGCNLRRTSVKTIAYGFRDIETE